MRCSYSVVKVCCDVSEECTASTFSMTESCSGRKEYIKYTGHIHFSHLLQHHPNQVQSTWRWRKHAPPKCQNKPLSYDIKTNTPLFPTFQKNKKNYTHTYIWNNPMKEKAEGKFEINFTAASRFFTVSLMTGSPCCKKPWTHDANAPPRLSLHASTTAARHFIRLCGSNVQTESLQSVRPSVWHSGRSSLIGESIDMSTCCLIWNI